MQCTWQKGGRVNCAWRTYHIWRKHSCWTEEWPVLVVRLLTLPFNNDSVFCGAMGEPLSNIIWLCFQSKTSRTQTQLSMPLSVTTLNKNTLFHEALAHLSIYKYSYLCIYIHTYMHIHICINMYA